MVNLKNRDIDEIADEAELLTDTNESDFYLKRIVQVGEQITTKNDAKKVTLQ